MFRTFPAQLSIVALPLLLSVSATAQTPLGTGFTYQGHLKNGESPASGLHDMRFRLYDALTDGVQVGTVQCLDNVNVLDGLFTVTLDFGAQFNGQERFLEIDVRDDTGLNCANPTGFTTLIPRQSVTPTPYALYAVHGGVVGIRTLADLRTSAIPVSSPGGVPSVVVLGYHAPGDGGGGGFFWDADSTEPDDGGLVIVPAGNPPAGRWKRVFSGPVHVEWWGPAGDGVTDDTQALQAAFAAASGRGIVFGAPRSYGFHPVLNIPADTRIQNNGATFRMLADPGGATMGVTVGARVKADLLKIRIAAGVQVRRLVLLGDDNTIDSIEISAEQRQSTNASTLDGALQIRSANVRLGHVAISDFDFAALAYQASRLTIERLCIRDYINGLHVRESSFVELLSGDITIPSPGASTLPGHNGLLFETSSDVVVSDMIVHDAGEHGIRIGGAGDSARFVFSNIQSIRPGQCGLKINPNDGFRVRDVQINGLTVVDAAATSTPGSNEDGLRLEKCSYVTVNGLQVQARDRAVSCFDGMYVNSCDFVTINGPRISNAGANGIHLQDLVGPVNEIFINNPAILFAANDGILIESPTQVIRDITVMGCFIRGQGSFGIRLQANSPTVGVNQPVILDGWIKNDGLGGVSISTSDPDVHDAITVVN